jgi:hypothetical protein
VLQGNAGQTRQVPGQQARGFLGIEAVGGDQGFLQVAQLLFQVLGEELLVEAGGWGLVGHGVARRLGCAKCSGSPTRNAVDLLRSCVILDKTINSTDDQSWMFHQQRWFTKNKFLF